MNPQPSDGQCPCPPGYQDVGEPRGCVQREPKNCKDGATWNQEGLCLTKDQWSHHCAHEVCATPGDAHGYDAGLGLCRCWGQRSSGMCGALCLEGQRHALQLSCSDGIPQVSITEGAGSQLLEEVICLTGRPDIRPPRSQEFYLLDRPSPPRAVGHPCNLDQRQKPIPLYVVRMDGTGFLGLIRPGRALLRSLGLLVRDPRPPGHDADNIPPPFSVPRGHFYNTLGGFDWGRLRALAEESQLQDQERYLFLQQFQEPGVYVFRLSSNRHRKMIQCHRLSWARKATPSPTFRKHQQGYNLDAYVSPRPGMTLVRRGPSHQDSDTPRVGGDHGGRWEAEEQVDLERFDPERFFAILLRQSVSVTTKLGQTKEELKLLCLRLLSEARSLRQLWGAERRIPASTGRLLGSPSSELQQPRRTSQMGAVMTDPATGIEVPVLAVTLHPQTRQWLALGGTYCNPLTRTLAPLELGGPMEDPVTGGISPILGVGLDEDTGQVLALGGLRDASGNLMLPGDSFEEPLSRKTVRLQGAARQEGRTVPHTGGSQALLDANVLVAQRRVLAVLRSYQERPGSRMQGPLEAAIKDMRQALALSLHHVLQQARRLERQLETAGGIAAGGGRLGTMCYPGTELWVPALYGMEIPDPEGSGLMVPILGMETDRNSGDPTPLAGSMEDADGKGLVPISIGAQAIDPLTGEPGPVIGAQTDPCSGVVVPIVQMLEALPRGVSDPRLLDALEKELRAREQYWHRREQEEVRLAEHLGHLSQELLSVPGKDAQRQLRAAEEACAALESCHLQETQRRARALSMQSGPERGLLSRADREEGEQEAQVALGMQRVLQSLGHAAEKLGQAVRRLRGQEEETWLQQSRGQRPQIWNRLRKVVQHLSDEFQEVVRERQSFLDRALGHLQYQRELSRLHLLHTQIVASGAPACLENYPGDRFYGTVTASLRDQAAACPLLIPFLKSLTAALVGAQGYGPGPEDQGPGTDTDKGDIAWTSPVFSTLKKVDIWSQARKEEAELQAQLRHQQASENCLQDVPKPQIMLKEDLIAVQATDLSAREFVVYQYGLSILDLLTPQLQVPEITLQIASHLPAMEASDNAFKGSFFFQVLQIQPQRRSAENILFVGRESLASVGSFILLLIYCLAHIAAKDFHQDSDPAFLRSFYKGLQAYFREAFSMALQMSAVSWDGKLDRSISAILLEEQPVSERGRDLLSKLIERKCESHLEPESSEEVTNFNWCSTCWLKIDFFMD
ncbi:Hypothetical predicted protein [Lynx pardinus]|uniref:Uncharacterized protein n=1 Tax=Lynx pardinus TaxID=191816 RepID=A0A485N3V9_LYNPA|nr:Hypothetical predicted protein [Lynx pardinus]